jgi:hypothetical protein
MPQPELITDNYDIGKYSYKCVVIQTTNKVIKILQSKPILIFLKG